MCSVRGLALSTLRIYRLLQKETRYKGMCLFVVDNEKGIQIIDVAALRVCFKSRYSSKQWSQSWCTDISWDSSLHNSSPISEIRASYVDTSSPHTPYLHLRDIKIYTQVGYGSGPCLVFSLPKDNIFSHEISPSSENSYIVLSENLSHHLYLTCSLDRTSFLKNRKHVLCAVTFLLKPQHEA